MAKFSINLKEGVLRKESDLIVGIDLGTTNSLVAYIKDGVATAVKGADGKHTLLPSIVHFAAGGAIVVGDEAKAQLIADPQNTIYSVKRLMGKSFRDVAGLGGHLGYRIIDEDTDSLVKIQVKDRFFTPIALSAEILKALKARIEQALGESVSKAVITVPAYFNDAQRQATRDAGKLAGLDVLRIVNEPTAASLAYGIGLDKADNQVIAVYDLGGGTFDISLLQIQDGIFEVLATHGDTFLGGDDFDQAIIDLWCRNASISPDDLSSDRSLGQAMRLAAEEAKKHLSTASEFATTVNGTALHISRSEFETQIAPLVARTIAACGLALADAKLGVADIQHVVMVGGSTRVPLVKEQVAAFFERPVYDKLNPDEVVALGAAIQADVLSGNQRDLLLLDVTPLSLGIEMVGGLMDVIVPRNTKVPLRVARQYTTSVDGQRNLKIAVCQGERDLVEHNRKLGEFVLKGIPPMPAGLPKIEIQFLLDADGILTVRAKELRSDVAQEIEIRSQYGISEEDMAAMLIESLNHAEEDMRARALLEARNEANNILLSADKFLVQHADILSAAEAAQTSQLVEALRHTVAGSDKDAINAAMQVLNDYTAPLAHRAMDATIAGAMKGKKM